MVLGVWRFRGLKPISAYIYNYLYIYIYAHTLIKRYIRAYIYGYIYIYIHTYTYIFALSNQKTVMSNGSWALATTDQVDKRLTLPTRTHIRFLVTGQDKLVLGFLPP